MRRLLLTLLLPCALPAADHWVKFTSGPFQVLTDAGTLLLDYADRMLNLREEIRKSMRELRGLERGQISLGVNESSIHALLPALARYRKLYPGVKLIMVSWAVYPALDPSRPAGLSARIVGGELRSRLGFGGVTITDALEADALKPYGAISHRALLAAQAGMDLILCSAQSLAEGTECVSGLEGGYGSGALPKAGFEAAAARVIALRGGLPH